MRKGTLRAIREFLDRPACKDEPVRALLECGHVVTSTQRSKRALCPLCKRGKSLRQAAARIRHALPRRIIKAEESPIFVSVRKVSKQAGRKRVITGYRVLRVQVWDETPTMVGTPRGLACEELGIACTAAGVQYVRAKLLEMAEALDGAVIVT